MAEKEKTQFAIIILLVISVYFTIAFSRQAVAHYHLLQDLERIEREVVVAEAENQRLEELKRYVQTDDYVEKVAREELKWGREGEIIFVIRTPDDQSVLALQPNAPLEGDPEEKGKAHWQEWWQLFFDSAPGTALLNRFD